jgi:hypothetical protein
MTQDKLKIEKKADNLNKLCLNFNGMDVLEWFRLKYQEIQKKNQLFLILFVFLPDKTRKSNIFAVILKISKM